MSILLVALALSGCQSLRTALKLDPHIAEHKIVKIIEESSSKHMVHVFVEHKWSKEKEDHYIHISGYVRDPQAKSFLHDIGLFKKEPSNFNKYLDRAYVEITFLNKNDKVVSKERIKVDKKYVLHGSHSHRSKFKLKIDDNPEISKCVLEINWF